MASWPNNLKVFASRHNFTDYVNDADVNDLQDELAAVQANLGTLPNQGSNLAGTTTTYATVKARLDGLISAVRGHLHNGSDGSGKLDQANTHQNPDTDTSTTALHHTLGNAANQAAPGPHNHSGTPIPTASVNGLDSALAGKAPTTHSHSYVAISSNGFTDGVKRLYRTDGNDGFHIAVTYDGSRWLLEGKNPDGSTHAAARVAKADVADSAGYAPTNSHGHDYAATNHGHGYMDPNGQYTMPASYPFTFPNITVGSTYGLTLSSGMVMQRNSSSRRYKKDIEDLHISVETLRGLRARQFRYDTEVAEVNPDEGRLMGGFIAEEVADVDPMLVIWNEEGTPEDIDLRGLVAAQQALINTLFDRVEALEAR